MRTLRAWPQTDVPPDVRVYVPKAESGGTYEQRVKRAVHYLWSRGVYPGPAAITIRVHGRARRDLNDREATWRTEEMLLLGIPLQRKRRERKVSLPGPYDGPA